MAVNTLTNGDMLHASVADFPPDSVVGLVPFWGTHKFAANSEVTAANDAILLCQFAAGVRLVALDVGSFHFKVPDIDDGAAAVFDVGLGDSDGEIDTVLINDSTVGQAGGVDLLDAAGNPPFIDVGEKYLIFKIVTPPGTDAAAGKTLEFFGLLTRNVSQRLKPV